MKPASAGRRALLLGGLALAGGCSEVPKGGVPAQPEPRLSRRLLPDELVPADLDLVVRVDLERLRRTLGAKLEDELRARYGGDPHLAQALSRGRAALVAVRAGDLEAGDHVVVIEGDPKGLDRAPEGFEARPSANERVRVYVRSVTAARAETDAIVVLDQRAVAFVSPLETDAVLRVLRDGADELRGRPVAEGLLSADVRPRRLPAQLERKFPSLARLMSQVQRVRARLDVSDDGLRVEAEIIAKSDAAADKVRRFLDVFREGASGDGASKLLKKMQLEKLGAVVRATSRLAIEDVAALLDSAPRGDG